MHSEPLLAEGAQGLSPLVLSPQLLPTNCPASCQREGAESRLCRKGVQLKAARGDGEGSASLVGGPGARGAALGTGED